MTVRIEKKDEVTTIIIDRPEVKNAIDGKTAGELADAFRSFEKDAEACAAVLYGAGDCFCAGADLKSMTESGMSYISSKASDVTAALIRWRHR